jgi:hypothetical protein
LSACTNTTETTERFVGYVLYLGDRHTEIPGDLLKGCWGFSGWGEESGDNRAFKFAEGLNRFLYTGGFRIRLSRHTREVSLEITRGVEELLQLLIVAYKLDTRLGAILASRCFQRGAGRRLPLGLFAVS